MRRERIGARGPLSILRRRPLSQRTASSKRRRSKTERKKALPRRRTIPWAAVIAGAVVLVIAFFIVRELQLGAPGERVIVSGVGVHPPEGQTIQYDSYPPVGGPHWPSPARWGLSTTQNPDERVVHNLEHGGIVIDHNAISGDDLAKLNALFTTYPRDKFGEVKLVIQPYDKIAPGTISLRAWGWRQILTGYDERAVRGFLDAHMNRGPEDVP